MQLGFPGLPCKENEQERYTATRSGGGETAAAQTIFTKEKVPTAKSTGLLDLDDK